MLVVLVVLVGVALGTACVRCRCCSSLPCPALPSPLWPDMPHNLRHNCSSFVPLSADTLHQNLQEVKDLFEIKRFALFDQVGAGWWAQG